MNVTLPLHLLLNFQDPFQVSPWGVALTRDALKDHIDRQDWDPTPGSKRHLERAAYLVVDRCPKPIKVTVSSPESDGALVLKVNDGMHRYVAAVYRNDPDIATELQGEPAIVKAFADQCLTDGSAVQNRDASTSLSAG